MTPTDKLAQRLAIGLPALLLAGAYISQYGFGLYPCEMCWWQRYGHFAAVMFGLVSYRAPQGRLWIALAALAIFASGEIGAFHAGIENGWWEGFTTCSRPPSADGGSAIDAILNAPLIRCDEAQWRLAGISLAGFNAIISIAVTLAIGWLLGKDRRA
ncbi:MAG: disulfide bond formation protein B [Croceibacterium sp.]